MGRSSAAAVESFPLRESMERASCSLLRVVASKKKATALQARATVSTHSSPFTELEVDAERGDEQWGVMWGRKRASKREERRERARER